MYFSAFIIHGALGITLFLWTPSKDKAYVFYIYVGVWAVGYAVYSATLSRKLFRNFCATQIC